MTAYEPLTFNITGNVDNDLIRRMIDFRDVLQQMQNANRPLNNLRNNVNRTTNAFTRLFASIRRIAFYRAIRAVLREISDGFREGRDNAYQYSKIIGGDFAKSMDRLATSTFYMKNSIGAMEMPIYNALVPAIEWLIDRFVVLINIINQFLSLLGGAATWTRALKYPKEYASAAKSATGAVKELQKTILGFDEINKLNKQSTGGGGGLADALDYSKMFEQANYSEFIKKHLVEIEAIVAGFEFALGVLLALMGHPLLGIALMAHGAYKLFKIQYTTNWEDLDSKIARNLATIEGTVAGFAFAAGALILLLGGNIPIGIGLMIVGGFMMASQFAASIGSGDDIVAKIGGIMTTIQGIIFGTMLAVGMMLLLMGATPMARALGLGLVAAGVIGFANAIASNWDEVPDNIKLRLQQITAIATLALYAIGVILTLTGHPALGLPLIISGMALQSTLIDWDYVANKVREKLNAIGNAWDSFRNRINNVVNSIRNTVQPLFNLLGAMDNARSTINLFGQKIAMPYISYHAAGGFPDKGSLFVAGEAGAEMIGNLGGRTAVANSNQIVDGIAQGLKYANADEIRLMREQNDLLRQILAKEGTATITLSSVTNALERKNQRDGSTYVPVG